MLALVACLMVGFGAVSVALVARGDVSVRTVVQASIFFSGTLAVVALYRETAGFDVHLRPQLEQKTDYPWQPMPHNALLRTVETWYQRYGTDLLVARSYARKWLMKGRPQSDEIELAISYLRIRATRRPSSGSVRLPKGIRRSSSWQRSSTTATASCTASGWRPLKQCGT
jgi:hypothetical protein